MNRRGCLGGFTLIEMLVVISMIVILAGITVPTISSIIDGQRKAKVRAMVVQIEKAIQNFQALYNRYPWEDDVPPPATATADIIRHLAPSDSRLILGPPPTITNRSDVLIIPVGAVSENSPGAGDATLRDVWGNQYRMLYDPAGRALTIWSLGPNGVDETSDGDSDCGDDITNL